LPNVGFHGPARQRALTIAATLTNRLNSCNVKPAIIGPQREGRARPSAVPPVPSTNGVTRLGGRVRRVAFFPPPKKSSPGAIFFLQSLKNPL
jgi:hypothetical protein